MLFLKFLYQTPEPLEYSFKKSSSDSLCDSFSIINIRHTPFHCQCVHIFHVSLFSCVFP